MTLTTDALRQVIWNHIINECPMDVFEREYNARTHLTSKFIDVTDYDLGYVPGGREVTMFRDVAHYKKRCIKQCYTKTGKPDYKSIYRLSKRKDKATKNVIREFSSTLILMDHTIVVTSDITDSQVISIDYVYKENEFLKEAQDKLKEKGLFHEYS